MKELDGELWKLGAPARTKHNEVAPCQHELAPIFEQGSVAIDNNLLTMEKMKLLASHHGLVCLQHEKPFEYVNGSGKHDNWSLSADGKNLLEPGPDPEHNLRFLVFLTALVAAVDEHADLMRASVASAGNDHRLGGNEAPPAIISVYLGDNLSPVVEALIRKEHAESQETEVVDLGVPALPDIIRDNTDRNRTSPFAFTGNKFEFRMPGSRQNLSDPNVVINTAVAEQCDRFVEYVTGRADEDFQVAALRWVRHTLRDHQRIVFEGNGYANEWEVEAERRGLPNLKTTPEAIPALVKPENIALFERYGVLNEAELRARYVAKAEQYEKLLNIEANTMSSMVHKLFLPAISRYSGDVATSVAAKADLGISSRSEKELVQRLTDGYDAIASTTAALEAKSAEARATDDVQLACELYRDEVIPLMNELRAKVDEMELVCGAECWPVPTYDQILFYV